jgi:hypothetical protein
MPRKVLFTQWFHGPTEVQTYNMYCLYKNLANPTLDSVVLFLDDPYFQNIFGEKLVPVPLNRRLAYNDWLDYSQQHYPHDINILANSDIFLNETLARVDLLQWDNTVHVLSRRDVTKTGNVRRSTVTYDGDTLCNPTWSQDCWMYSGALPKLTKTIYIGVMHCENHFRADLQKQSVTFNNITGRVDCFHVDWRADKPRSIPDYSLAYGTAATPCARYAFE